MKEYFDFNVKNLIKLTEQSRTSDVFLNLFSCNDIASKNQS